MPVITTFGIRQKIIERGVVVAIPVFIDDEESFEKSISSSAIATGAEKSMARAAVAPERQPKRANFLIVFCC